MRLETRKLLDRSFSGVGIVSIVCMAAALLIILGPMMIRGLDAFLFYGTADYRIMSLQQFERGDRDEVMKEYQEVQDLRKRLAFEPVTRFETELKARDWVAYARYRDNLEDLKEKLRELFGPFPGEDPPLKRDQYGATRWDRAKVKRHELIYLERWDHSGDESVKYYIERAEQFAGTELEGLIPTIDENFEALVRPEFTFYPQFLTDRQVDSHAFGGIWAELVGTVCLAIGAMIFAVPMGVIAAIYFVEYAGDNRFVRLLRSCVNTLAGVPSIVFGLFGLAFFIGTIKVSKSKSVLAGSLTLGLLVLPIIIRASEEAIRAVPRTYKEAALSLGASKWRTVITVLLPAALPGILTGIVISMGRAAGETAPIIFTAAWSLAPPLSSLRDTFTQGTPALPWSIYNLVKENTMVEELRHVQFGMVFTLVTLVLLLNAAALILRAKVSKKLRG
ncbi:MAG: phosphate ABC transporter permease PstA [Planctomycetota bacterium]